MSCFLIIAPSVLSYLSECISGMGAAIEVQQSATKSSSTVLLPSTTNSKSRDNKKLTLLSYSLTSVRVLEDAYTHIIYIQIFLSRLSTMGTRYRSQGRGTIQKHNV